MEGVLYIQVAQLFKIVQDIPGSSAGNSVTIKIKRLSDGYTWNFSTLAFQNADNSGAMSNITGTTFWQSSFTPDTLDQFLVSINNVDIDVPYSQQYISQGIIAQAGLSGSELTSLASLREYLKIQTTDIVDDTLLQSLITRISAQVEKNCNRSFMAAVRTEYYKGNDQSFIYVRNPPVNSVSSIHIDEAREWGSDTLVAAADIQISSENPGKIILYGQEFYAPSYEIENVRIIYNGGYAVVPADLQQAVNKLCAAEYIEAGGIVNNPKKTKDPSELRDEAWKYIDANYRLISI
jgi:uncharacterized phiE125 gp8 family phage protein